MKPQTTLVHAGERRPLGNYIPVSTPIFASSSFFYPTTEELADVFAERLPGETYARMGNPTASALEEQVAAVEDGHAAIATASGMAAVHLAILAGLLDRRQAIVAADVLYGGTLELLRTVLPSEGVEVRFCDFCDLEAVEAAVREVRPALLLTETISNPALRVARLDRLREIASEYGALFLVDNTFTPLLIKPFDHGADMVIHSATKYLGGHGDVLAGAVVVPEEHAERCGRPIAAWAETSGRSKPTWSCAGSRRCPCACGTTAPTPAWFSKGCGDIPRSSGSSFRATRNTLTPRRYTS